MLTGICADRTAPRWPQSHRGYWSSGLTLDRRGLGYGKSHTAAWQCLAFPLTSIPGKGKWFSLFHERPVKGLSVSTQTRVFKEQSFFLPCLSTLSLSLFRFFSPPSQSFLYRIRPRQLRSLAPFMGLPGDKNECCFFSLQTQSFIASVNYLTILIAIPKCFSLILDLGNMHILVVEFCFLFIEGYIIFLFRILIQIHLLIFESWSDLTFLNKLCLLMMYYLSYVLLVLICWYTVKSFLYICSWGILVCGLFSCNV